MINWIPGYEQLYSANKEGKIYSHLSKIRELKGYVNSKGYRMVTLRKDGKSTKYQWHRVIALTFIQTSDITLTIDHIDENKLNNAIYNLRWCTRQDNVKYYATNKERQQLRKTLREKRKEELRSKKDKLAKPIIQGTTIFINGVKYNSQREAARFLIAQPSVNASEDTIRKELRNLVNGKRNAWMYQGKYFISLT